MAPPTKPSEPSYAPLANPATSPDPNYSPDPNGGDAYAALGGRNLRDSSILSPSPDLYQNPLGRSGSDYLPAPSIMTRDSTYGSLPGTPPLRGDNRQSWGSNVGLAAAADGVAGGDARRPSVPRGQSALAQHSTLGWNNADNERLSVSDEDDEQGHITPAVAAIGAGEKQSEKPRWAAGGDQYTSRKKSRKWLWALLGAGLLAIIALAVGLGIGLTRKHNNTAGSTSSSADGAQGDKSTSKSGTATGTSASSSATPIPTTGTQGSLIKMEDGTTFTYNNPFGGSWVWDEANPFNNDAKVNSWTPKLSEEWVWGRDKAYGVNVGGWLVTEPFIVPGLYEKYATGASNTTAIDEYTLSLNMGDDLTAALTEHYETFITEKDFAEMAAAGLNYVRIPIGFWAIETWDGEPFLERVSWSYFLKAVKWCRKYGLRINLDLHTVPGSQNGWNHSGRQGTINWMNGVMGLANAERSLDYIRTLAQFIAQPEYAPVVTLFGFINEPNAGGVGKPAVGSFYYEAYKIIRDITGIGAGNGPFLSIHDGFIGIQQWYDFLPGADRVALDQHTYIVFQDQHAGSLDDLANIPCSWWASATNTTSQTYGVNVAGEWSAAWNDCGQWVNNVGSGSRYDGTYQGYAGKRMGSCDMWNDYTTWNQTTIDSLHRFVAGSMDALQNYFFWTWKIGNSTNAITQPNPFWNYQLGLEHGWIPKDPREAIGVCAAQAGVTQNAFDGTFTGAYMTGGVGANSIAAAQASSYPWPPASFTNVAAGDMDSLPQYTQTGTPITMPGPTFTSPGSSATISAGSGWFNAAGDTRQAYVAVAGCSYPPEYSAASLAIPASACGAGLAQPTKRSELPERAAFPQPTSAPAQR
ncbi:hypothetical protein CI109_101533 [Kwoniella shandongensis]|uniref:glucan 1,3-beta-glucosidase n=1 Tax=Kwoniella shandongensis TaxID=1734106 RepID=A0A5M6C6S5_9TREE|nr:uncharacterized protein CI109_001335 [Kwoniella shandongensis]KAA5530531.1 hypothetical protein CI109_001335 [Kwoniella shandongensis]